MPPYQSNAFADDDEVFGLFATLDINEDEPRRRRPVPLVGVKVEAEVMDFIAEVKLSQCYHNTDDKAIEAVYNFPIDEAAAVCGFQAEHEDGSIVKGVVKEKAEAKKEYHQAVNAGKQANLLETVRRDIFTLNVGNLPADGHVTITITYVTTLKAREDAAAFVLPTCIAPRYSPPSRECSGRYTTTKKTSSEDQALNPPMSSVKLFGLDIQVNVSCRSKICSITSPTHSSEDSMKCQINGKTGHFEMQDITMDRDLVILVQEEECHQPRASLEVSEDGTMTGFVTFFPQIEFPDQPREFIFVIDRSGSMGGQQIQEAREALLLFLRALPASCTFNIVGFGSRYDSLFPTPQAYNDYTLEEASNYAQNMTANFGGTEIAAPLRHVFGQAPAPGVERQIFVLTDGQVENDLQVFDLIRKNCSTPGVSGLVPQKRKCRLFCIGIGKGVSRHLVEGMARAGRGTSRFVEDGGADALRVKVLGQLKQALQPALNDVSIEWQFPKKEQSTISYESKPKLVKTLLGYRSPAVDEAASAPPPSQPKMYPSMTPPIFNKEKFLSFAIFPPGSLVPESVKVTCNSNDGPLDVLLHISEEETFQGSVACKMAARTAISEFEDHRKSRRGGRFNRGTAPVTILSEQEALRLALDNCLASEQTSFIAIHENVVVAHGAPTAKKVIPQCVSDLPLPVRSAPECLDWLRGPPAANYSNFDCEFALLGGAVARRAASPPSSVYSSASPAYSPSPAHYSNSADCFYSGLSSLYCAKSKPRGIPRAFIVPDGFHSSSSDKNLQKRYGHQAVGSKSVPDDMQDDGVAEKYIRPDGTKVRRIRRTAATGAPAKLPRGCVGAAKSKMAAPSMKGRGHSNQLQQPNSRPAAQRPTAVMPAAKMPPPSNAPPDTVLALCLLQKADGSFIYDTNLTHVIGISIDEMNRICELCHNDPNGIILALDPVLFATALAVAAMREKFAKQQEVWELQEEKAMQCLRSRLAHQQEQMRLGLLMIQSELRNTLK